MRIYQIEYDIDEYQDLRWRKTGDKLPITVFNGRPLELALTPPEVYSASPKLKRGDFWHFKYSFAMPPASLSKVRQFMDEAGELVPLPYRNEEFHVLNVLRCEDCLDMTAFIRNDDSSYRFDPARVPRGIFKILFPAGDGRAQAYAGNYIYVSEIDGDPTREFRAFVEKEEMTGLLFREVWSDEG